MKNAIKRNYSLLPPKLLTALFSVAVLLAGPAAADGLDTLRAEVARIAASVEGNVGASIAYAGEDPIPLINGDKQFPMMSTVKTVVSMQALDRVAAGEMALDTQVTITDEDLSVMSPINMTFPAAPTSTSLENLIWTAIVDSDNTAPNTMMRVMGGPEGVTDFVRAQGIEGIRVDRNINRLFVDVYQLNNFAEVKVLIKEKSREPGGIMGFFDGPIDSPLLTDPRDTTTPSAMAALLSKFAAGEVVDAPRTELLMSIMEQTRTGAGRIKGMLPPGTVVGHKTGTGHNVTNDAGYIRLPDGRILVVAVYTNSPSAISRKEQAIAQIARAAYDWALYTK